MSLLSLILSNDSPLAILLVVGSKFWKNHFSFVVTKDVLLLVNLIIGDNIIASLRSSKHADFFSEEGLAS